MDSIASFLAMGGYAAYVWPAYGVTTLVVLALVIGSLRELRGRERELKKLEEARGPRPRRGRRK